MCANYMCAAAQPESSARWRWRTEACRGTARKAAHGAGKKEAKEARRGAGKKEARRGAL
jgi:hypothetical protein